MDHTGGLSIVLLRDEFSAEIPAKKWKVCRSYLKGPPRQLVCVVKNAAGVYA